MAITKKVFSQSRPNGSGNNGAMYTWSPPPNDLTKKASGAPEKPFYCDAVGGSQGQDWVTTYVYELLVVNNERKRLAYVACDYVQ